MIKDEAQCFFIVEFFFSIHGITTMLPITSHSNALAYHFKIFAISFSFSLVVFTSVPIKFHYTY